MSNEVMKSTESNKNISVSIELLVPKHQFNTMEFAEKFHNQFVGNPDYVNSNIVVHDDGNQHTGATIVVDDLEDYLRFKKELTEALEDCFGVIELGMSDDKKQELLSGKQVINVAPDKTIPHDTDITHEYEVSVQNLMGESKTALVSSGGYNEALKRVIEKYTDVLNLPPFDEFHKHGKVIDDGFGRRWHTDDGFTATAVKLDGLRKVYGEDVIEIIDLSEQ